MNKWFEKILPRQDALTHPKLGAKASSVGSMIAYSHIGQAVWTPRQYDRLTEEGYRKNVIVYRAVNLIARGAASVPWRLYRGNDELHQHPLLDLLHTPNPRLGGSAFIESMLNYLLLSGNSYIEAVCDTQGQPVELYTLRPDRMKVIPGAQGFPEAFEYTVDGKGRKISVDPHKGHSAVLHLKLFHPLNDWYGMSPIEAAATAIDQHNAVAQHNLSLLQNGGRPSGALLMKGTNYQTQEQKQEFVDDFREAYSGEGQAGKIMVMEGDLAWQEMGLSPKDLDFVEGKCLSAREIAQAFNVPPMLVGIHGDATFANYKEARYHLWEDTILPLLDYVIDELNHWLVRAFGPDLRLTYDIDKIPALAQRREEAWGKISQANFLTINEKRRAVGYAPIADGDKF